MRPLRLLLTALAMLALATLAAGAQSEGVPWRFEITEVGDTTFTFPVRDGAWVKPKQRGIAIDPRQRDALVARFEVLSVRDGVATALITGATSRVTRDHIAQLSQPPRAWWKNGGTWAGLGLGLAAGFALGSSR